MQQLRRSLVFGLALLLLSSAAKAQEDAASPSRKKPSMFSGMCLIQGGTIYSMTHEKPFQGDLLIRDGKIAALGSGLRVPPGVKRIDAKGKTVMPGLVDGHSGFLVEQWPKTSSRIDSEAIEAFDRFRVEEMGWAVERGVTAVALHPTARDGFTGRVSVVKFMPGAPLEALLVKRDVALRAGVGLSGLGMAYARVKLVHSLDKQLKAAEDYKEAWSTYDEELEEYLEKVKERSKEEEKKEEKEKEKKEGEKKEGDASFAEEEKKKKKEGDDKKKEEELKKPKRPTFDMTKDLLVKARAGEIAVHVEVHRAADILNVLELKRKHYLDLVLLGCTEGYLVREAIDEAGVPVILGLVQRPALEEQNAYLFHEPGCARMLLEQGISLALASSGRAGLETRFLASIAAQAAGAGLDRQAALKAITIWPAQILGVDDRIGSLERGKDADIVIMSGHPFESNATVDQVLINGTTVFERAE